MIVLDTDHLSEMQRQRTQPSETPLSERGERLFQRLAGSSDQEVVTTIITAEEQMRGRLARIHRTGARRTGSEDAELAAYDQLIFLFTYYASWTILPYNRAALQIFRSFPPRLVRQIGTMDSKIAAIVLAHEAKLLSANLRHFRQVPGLQVEDWLHD
jgi:tRNA(fMet)-specific endonuclease VapC